tara:strand:+ start:239 stop:514 length:276 start_codon:yes stop_codon:yes gene_type:complete
MKKSVRLFLTGNLQSLFFKQFVKEHADQHKVNGYLRQLEDGRMEIFLEGPIDSVNALLPICKRGPQHSQIRNIDESPASHQGFTEFKILKI